MITLVSLLLGNNFSFFFILKNDGKETIAKSKAAVTKKKQTRHQGKENNNFKNLSNDTVEKNDNITGDTKSQETLLSVAHTVS